MRQHERSLGESRRRRYALAVAVTGALALIAAIPSSGTTAAKAPTRHVADAAPQPPAEGCIAITAVDQGRPPDEGSIYAFTLIGRWNAGTHPVGERLTITEETSAGPGESETEPLVPVRTDGSLPELLSFQFPAAEVAAQYAVQGTIVLRRGSHIFAPVTPFCETDVTVSAAPYQEAPEGTVTVTNNG